MPALPEEAIEALRAKGHNIPTDTVRYVLDGRQGNSIRSDLQPDSTWLKSSSVTTRASPVAESGTGRF
jgi:lipid-binding SYLF domain-containing protein